MAGPARPLTGTAPGTQLTGTPGVPARVARAYLDHLAVERGLAANSLAAYRRDLDRYLEHLSHLGVVELGAVGTAVVAAYLVRLREGDDDHPPLAASSAARALVPVRGLHRFAVREGVIAVDRAADVRPPPPGRRLPKALTVEEVEALISAAGFDATPLAWRDAALLELLYATGARISEAVALDLDDVPAAGAPSSVRLHGKGGKDRVVPVGRMATAALDAYRVRGRPTLAIRGQGSPAVFLNARGGRLSRQSAWLVLRATAEKAGISRDISPHTLRHSFATHLLDGGADVRTVQELLGHASVVTTQIYTLVTAQHLAEVYAASHPRARG
jgi:integrase/recombinase XerD